MDRVTALLDRARDAGLTVTRDGERLVIRGAKKHARLAEALIARQPEVMALLAPPTRPECGQPMKRSVVVIAGDQAWYCESPQHPRSIPVRWTREDQG